MSAVSAQAAIRPARWDRILDASSVSITADFGYLEKSFRALSLDNPDKYSPAFFLASVSQRSWRPHIIVVQDQLKGPIGLLYAKERKLCGIRTGLYFADATLGSFIVSREADAEEVFRAGMQALVATPGFYGLRILVPPRGYEPAVLSEAARQTGLEAVTAPAEVHLTLPLAASYEEFCLRLNPKTRRNFRYFRNRSDKAGHQFHAGVSLSEFEAAAWKLHGERGVGADAQALSRALEMFAASSRPLLVGLRSESGEWISLMGGWFEQDRVVIFMQLNSDRRFAKYSPSLVIRACLIESLIQQGCPEIIWWSGVGEPINHYTTPVPTAWMYLDRSSPGWSALRSLLRRNRSHLPRHLQGMSEWVVPGAEAVAYRSGTEHLSLE
jgi:hypothetical protein